MINLPWLKLPISWTNFNGPKDVRATEVWLYSRQHICYKATQNKEPSSSFPNKMTTLSDRSHQTDINVTKACLYNFDPLKPTFIIVELGFTGVYIIFLISAQKHCGFSQYPQSTFWAEIRKISDFVYLKIFSFGRWFFSIYLNRRGFVMDNRTIHVRSPATPILKEQYKNHHLTQEPPPYTRTTTLHKKHHLTQEPPPSNGQ